MNSIISEIEAEQLRDVMPEFSVGDTVVVRVKVKEGVASGCNRSRVWSSPDAIAD